MVTIEALQDFEHHIRAVISQFETAFGSANPVRLWRSGQVARTGILNNNDGEELEYSFHGIGCTVTFRGRVVSFDFDMDDKYCYSVFKLLLFLDDKSPDEAKAALQFTELARQGVLVQKPSYRLAQAFGGI